MKRLITVVFLLLLTIAPSSLWAQNAVAVYQESSPGAGDFDANFLGCVDVFDQSEFTAKAVYKYTASTASYNGTVIPTIPDTSQLFVVNTSDGVSLFVVHDERNDGDGGRAEMRFELSGDPDGAQRLVEDDPYDATRQGSKGSKPGSEIFQTHHVWDPCCTDGVVIGALDDTWSMLVSFHNVDGVPGNELEGITNWVATSEDDTIALNLTVDRRVLLEPCDVDLYIDIKPGSCPNEFKCMRSIEDIEGTLTVAICGTAQLDVRDIDPATIRLSRNGISGSLTWIQHDYYDVATPLLDAETCECHDLNGDGVEDLVLEFDRRTVAEQLMVCGSEGEEIPLRITANLYEELGGGILDGEDCIAIVRCGCVCDLNCDGICDEQDLIIFGESHGWDDWDCNEPGVECICDLVKDENGTCDSLDGDVFREAYSRAECRGAVYFESIQPKSCEPGDEIAIIGSGFGVGIVGDGTPEGSRSVLHIGRKGFEYGHRKIKRWTDKEIIFEVPKKKYTKKDCRWFKGKNARKVKVWVTVGGFDTNTNRLKILKPDTCQPCTTNSECGAEEWCAKPVGDCDGFGSCASVPQGCPLLLDPVCGCDGITYPNDCVAAMSGVNVAYKGECVP